MNTWSGLKTRKAGEHPSETAVRPPDPPGNVSLDATCPDPAASSNYFPSNPHSTAGAPSSEQNPEGYAKQGSPQHSPRASKSMEVIDRFGQLIQDWAKPSRAGPQSHGNPSNPSSPSVARVIGQPPTVFRPASAGGSAFSPAIASLQVETWQSQQHEEGGDGKWPVRLFPGIHMPNAGASNAAQEGMTTPPPTTTTPAGTPADPSPTSLPPSFGGAQQFDYRLPFSEALLERRVQIPPGLEIARVIDARSGLQSHTLEPSYYDFLQLEGRPSEATQGDAEVAAHNVPGHSALEIHHLPSSGGPITSIPFFHHRPPSLQRGGFKVPTLVPPQGEPDFQDISPNQPETPTNLGTPIAKDPDAWEEKPVQENKAGGGLQEEIAVKGVRGVYDKKTGLFQQAKGGFRAFSGGLAYRDTEGRPPGGSGLVAQRTWSALRVTSPPGSPPRTLSDSGLKRAWEGSGVADSLGKRSRLTLEHTAQGHTDEDRSEPERPEASIRNDDPQDDVASERPSGPPFPGELANGLGRQLADAHRQLSDARGQLSDARGQLSDAHRQVSDSRQQLANTQTSWEADRRQWRQKEAAWEAFRTARMHPGGSPVAGGGSPAVGRGHVAGGGSPAVGRAPRFSEDEIGRLISERLIRTESMLIAALAEIGRLRAWIAGMRAAPRAAAGGAPPEASASGDTGRA